eukprot:6724701-Pyramimonas_sp.AAC.1
MGFGSSLGCPAAVRDDPGGPARPLARRSCWEASRSERILQEPAKTPGRQRNLAFSLTLRPHVVLVTTERLRTGEGPQPPPRTRL